MKPRKLRRISQLAFLALFAVFVFLAAPRNPFLQADPLAAAASALSTYAIFRGLLWSLVVLIPTLFLGRVFCGWVCPLGTLNEFASPRRATHFRRWQVLKYYILAAALAAALAGIALAGLLDPISLAARSFTIAIVPALARVLPIAIRPPREDQAFLVGLLFVLVLAANLRATRFWCRALCPLGALLGAVSRWSVLGLRKSAADCGNCNRCLLACQGGDDPAPGRRWRKSECHLCMNCVVACPESALRFEWFPERESNRLNLHRRTALLSLAAGAAAVPLLRAAPESTDRRIRPPGALEESRFLARCIRCGECMKACPNGALHPATLQAGLEGLWTPVLVARTGYCEPGCIACGRVCPTGAIREFTLAEKGWTTPAQPAGPIRIGTAFYDRGRCLPWAMATECIVCEEWCPTSPKAVYLRPAEVAGADGQTRTVRQPYIDAARCVGCGACEYACPVRDRPAVYVTGIGESRSGANRLLLGGASKPAAPPETADWRPTRVRAYRPDTLYEYMDGGAEKYIRAGLESSTVIDYRWRGRVDAVAEMHAMRTPDAAARLFDSEPAAVSRTVPVGDAARLTDTTLTCRFGRNFVRIIAYDKLDSESLVALARALAR